MRELSLVVGDGSVSAEQAVDASQVQTTELSSTAPPSTQMSSTPPASTQGPRTEETAPLQALLPISIPTLPLSAPHRRRIGVLVTMFWGLLVTRGQGRRRKGISAFYPSTHAKGIVLFIFTPILRHG
jgi:hypothetical protein